MIFHGHYSTHSDVDPSVRTYAVGEDAVKEVVRLAATEGEVATDIETAGLNELSYQLKVIIIGTATHACVLDANDPRHVEASKEALNAAESIVLHNSAFDIPPMYAWGGIELDDIEKVTDTLIYARQALTDSVAGKGLGDLERTVLRASTGKAQKDRFNQWAKINFRTKSEAFLKARYDDPAYVMYAGYDAIITARLREPLWRMAVAAMSNHPFGRYGATKDEAIGLIEREQIINKMMLRRSARGMARDPDRLHGEQDRLQRDQSDLDQTMRSFGITSPTNPSQLIKVVEPYLPDTYPRTEKTNKPSTAGDNLAAINHPAARAYTSYAENNRLMNYLISAARIADVTDGRIHPVVGVMKAVTGRMSYSLPATHQFTEPAREMILSDDWETFEYRTENGITVPVGGLTSLDWSQIEPVIGANLSRDTQALELYESIDGGDLYQAAADAGHVTRKHAKVILLAMLYQQGITALAKALGMSIAEAMEVREKVARAVPMTDRLTKWTIEWSRLTGMTWTLSGRIVKVNPMTAYQGSNYCVAPDTLILRADLNHVPASKIKVGDELVAFDEHPQHIPGERISYRKMRIAVVEAISTVLKPSVAVTTDDGVITVCSADHLWLIRPNKKSSRKSNTSWVRADELCPNDEFLSVGTWEPDNSRMAGYLAGLFDGEGCLTTRNDVGRETSLHFSQLKGRVMDEFCKGMDSLDLGYGYGTRPPNSTSPCDGVHISGVRNVMRTLGVLHPQRFVPKYRAIYEGASITAGLTSSVKVRSAVPVADQVLVSIQTSTRTLIANGYLSHNCIQGSSYDMLAEAKVEIKRRGMQDGFMLSQHDELVVQQQIAGEVQEIMRTPSPRMIELCGRVPKLRTDRADLGERWRTSHPCTECNSETMLRYTPVGWRCSRH